MKGGRVFLLFFSSVLFLHFAGCTVPYEPHVVLSGEPFEFPKNLSGPSSGELRHHSGQVRVAVLRDGVWTPTQDYEDRIPISSSLTFNRTVYTDTGLYVFSTGSQDVLIDLQVLVPRVPVPVPEGGRVSLPCFHQTRDSSCGSLRWERTGTTVLEVGSCSGTGTGTGTGRSGDGVSVSPHWKRDGDLSLTVKEELLQDGGVYVCYYRGGEERERAVGAVRVTTPPSIPPSTPPSTTPPTSTPCSCPPPSVMEWSWSTAGITALVVIISGAALVGLYLKKRKKSSNISNEEAAQPQDTTDQNEMNVKVEMNGNVPHPTGEDEKEEERTHERSRLNSYRVV